MKKSKKIKSKNIIEKMLAADFEKEIRDDDIVMEKIEKIIFERRGKRKRKKLAKTIK